MKPDYLKASVTIYATIERSEAVRWFENRVYEADDDDQPSLWQRLNDFTDSLGDDNQLQTYLNNGGTFNDTDVDHDEYMQHCFDKL